MYATTHPGSRVGSAGEALMSQPQPIRAPGYGHVPPSAASPDRERSTPPEHAAAQAGRGASNDRQPPDERAAAREAWYHARVWAGIRTEVAHRLVGMNVRHGMHAWAARRNRPVAPWAVAFLYTHPPMSPTTGWRSTRWWRRPAWSTTTRTCRVRLICCTAWAASPTSGIGTSGAGSTQASCAPTPIRSTPPPRSSGLDCPAWPTPPSRGRSCAAATPMTSPAIVLEHVEGVAPGRERVDGSGRDGE